MKRIKPFTLPSSSYRAILVLLLILFGCRLENIFAQTNALLFRDDFNRSTLGENWQVDESWSIIKGTAYCPSDFGTLVTSQKIPVNSYVIETAVKGFSDSYWRQFRLTFGQADLSDQSTYVLTYSPDSGGRLTLGRATDNIYHPEILDEISIHPDLEKTRWYKFKVARYQSGLIQVYVDNGTGYDKLPVLEAIDSTYQQLGHFGWKVSTQTAGENFFVDWIEARTPVIEKPAVLEKPAEDNLITQVSASSGRSNQVLKLEVGSKPYMDRDYQITSVPAYLQGASYIQTAMADKLNTQTSFLTTFMKKAVVVYVAYDPRATALPDWLKGWQKTGDIIGTTDPGSSYLEVYSKLTDYWQVYPRPFILGGNLASPAVGAKMNYLVAAVEVPSISILEAEEALVMGAQVAKNHTGFSGSGFVDFINKQQDYIEWTTSIEVPGTYSLSFKFANGSTSNRALHLTIDEIGAATVTFNPIASWANWVFHSGPKVYLTKGTHKIRVTAIDTSGPNIDYLSLSYVSNALEKGTFSTYSRKVTAHSEAVFTPAGTYSLAYPNPFESSTTISYSLPEKSRVNLAVYDIRGQKLKVLVDNMQAAGNYKIEFNAMELPKGLYIYHLKQANKLTVGKLLKK